MLTEDEIEQRFMRRLELEASLKHEVSIGCPTASDRKAAKERAIVLPRPKLDRATTPHAFRRQQMGATHSRQNSRRGDQ